MTRMNDQLSMDLWRHMKVSMREIRHRKSRRTIIRTRLPMPTLFVQRPPPRQNDAAGAFTGAASYPTLARDLQQHSKQRSNMEGSRRGAQVAEGCRGVAEGSRLAQEESGRVADGRGVH